MSRVKLVGKTVGVLVVGLGVAVFPLVLDGAPRSVARAQVSLPSPRDALKITIDQLVDTVERLRGKDKAVERRHALRQIIDPKFDFAEMSVRSLGPLWKELPSEQQAEFTKVFSELLARTYLSRIETIERGMVTIDSEKISPSTGGEARAIVRTVVSQKGDRFPILYKVVFRSNQWQVYDVVIENVGLVANYRNEFSGIIRREGFPGLMERLRTKVANGE